MHQTPGWKQNPDYNSFPFQMLTVELCRGWNSRLGFSLQSSESGTYISAIYADSVAAKDGRLQSGDQVIMVRTETNDIDYKKSILIS